MQNGLTTVIRKGVTAAGVGLLQAGLEREGAKGCSPLLCTEPVALEPPFQTFDAAHVLSFAPGTASKAEVALAAPDPGGLVTFELFPAEEDQLSITWMETLLRALAVLPGPMAFELAGSAGRVWVRFALPERHVPGFCAALLGHFPALRLRRQETPFPETPPAAVNELCPVGPYHRSLTLLGQEGASPLGLAAHVIADLEHDQVGVFQVLLAPASPAHDWHYNVENLVEAELRATRLAQLGGLSSDFSYDGQLPPLLELAVCEKVRVDVAFFATVARYAVWNTDEDATEAFLQGLRVATGMLRFGNRAWRLLTHETLIQGMGAAAVNEMVTRRASHRPGVMLTSREVASLVHLPNARTLAMLASIQQRTGHEWSPLETDEPTIALGTNEYAGESRIVALPTSTRLRQTYVAGATGYGKSKLLEHLAVEDAYAGTGFCVIDPHGDLCLDLLSRLPEARLADLVYLSFSEPGLVPRWNPFRADAPSGKLADDIARGFVAQTTTSGARMEHNFRMLAYVVHQLGGTLDDLAELAGRTPRGNLLRERAIEQIPNPQAQRFLRAELPKYTAGELGSVTNKLSRLLLEENLGAMFRQAENAVHPRAWLDQGRAVLVDLSSGHIGADHARFVGGLLVSLLYRAALTRADTPPEERRPFVLYIDEFQQLQTGTLSEILSEGRKYGLAAVLAHQERGQLGTELGQALGNCGTKIIFRPSEDDLPFLHRIFGSQVDPQELRSLGVGQALLSCGGRIASLTTHLTTRPRLREPREAARAYAAAHYTPVAESTIGQATAPRPRVYDTFGPPREDP